MPDDPNQPGEPPRDINGNPVPPSPFEAPAPRPLPNNPLPNTPLPPSGGGPPAGGTPGAQQYGQPGDQKYDLAGNPIPPAGGPPPPQSPYYTAPPGGPSPYGAPPQGGAYGQAPSPYGQPQGPYGQPQYYPVQVNGNQILTMGIVAFFCAGIILGPMAYVQGNSALAAIDRGEADPLQRGNVAAGRLCGLIAGSISALVLVGYAILAVIGLAAGGGH